MVNLPKAGPWIPGQQLYGTMIPRPDHESSNQQQALKKLNKRLPNLEALVKEIMEADGMSKYERLKFNKIGVDTDLPSSMGYEVIPQSVDSLVGIPQAPKSHQVARDSSGPSKTRLCVILSEAESMNFESSICVVLESDGFETYELSAERFSSDEAPEEAYEEAGLEVVALGRLSTFYETADDEIQLFKSLSEDDLGDSSASGLSASYQRSENVHVAFFRPMPGKERQVVEKR